MTGQTRLSTLYLCYFGLREPLVQTQVLPYLRQISDGGVEVNLLTFEPNRSRDWSIEDVESWKIRLQANGIRWFSLPYHKRPSIPATVYDILNGAQFVARLIRRHKIDVLHARSHIPMAIGLLVRRWTGCRLVFDLRGLLAEEYADAGIWTEYSLSFRAVKRLERAGLKRAEQIVVLTQGMRDWLTENKLADRGRIEVIPCCVDLSRFAGENSGDPTPVSDRFHVIYVGSVTGRYLLEEMGRFFLALHARQPNAFFRILTNAPPDSVHQSLYHIGLDKTLFSVTKARPDEVPAHLREGRLGLFFLQPSISQIAVSATKIPEYLAAGMPVVTNSGIGDTDELLERARIGVIVRSFGPDAYSEVAEKALELCADTNVRARCMSTASQYFDLTGIGRIGYLRVYRRLQEKIHIKG